MEPSAGNDKIRDFVLLLLVLLFFCGLVYGCPGGVMIRARNTPGFSAMVTDTGSLDPLRSPVIHPVFGLTLRIDNYAYSRMCRENATVTVSYGGVILGWGGLEDLCVDKRASTEVMVPLSHADVILTDELRRNMASELRAGELEVSVELRMLFPKGHECDYCGPQILQYCRVKPAGQGYSPCHCHALKPY